MINILEQLQKSFTQKKLHKMPIKIALKLSKVFTNYQKCLQKYLLNNIEITCQTLPFLTISKCKWTMIEMINMLLQSSLKGL